ncbi:hypothetical protein CLAFUW4_08193 [Fulvia fulva]|uniref:Uncharacterized protein n=1 Tax=Passalora fulva TaxID=5499 RepID=A0A9Q8LD50_PASFU|nr:uncharacterized protein CLAFUR5_08306 [Fulvia fulva]KAK4629675.1 hypothetical protein CLAFUR4_08198 [Fulvia fulva]KAK4630032.1 hypothetical protein CLAFUR0_08193 [Fulvia fulva]UJO15039.1 hypothetical protein CLAFUR5_08306 [Fulvia fulva]WPV12597.1 hypothetical protein CLAFUW4_08193 [Fulvia fulva]WPV27158.1 hypothetical protein CLAFUW7_08193 [Fulvia fulva]
MDNEESSTDGDIKLMPALAKGTVDPETSISYAYRPLNNREVRLPKLVPVETPPPAPIEINEAGGRPYVPNARQRVAAYARHLGSKKLFHRLQLIHVNLDHAPPYDPISYT